MAPDYYLEPVRRISATIRAVKRGEDAGFAAYVTKPFDVADFLVTLEEVTAGQTPGRSQARSRCAMGVDTLDG